jgi:hypothetical protein
LLPSNWEVEVQNLISNSINISVSISIIQLQIRALYCMGNSHLAAAAEFEKIVSTAIAAKADIGLIENFQVENHKIYLPLK